MKPRKCEINPHVFMTCILHERNFCQGTLIIILQCCKETGINDQVSSQCYNSNQQLYLKISRVPVFSFNNIINAEPENIFKANKVSKQILKWLDIIIIYICESSTIYHLQTSKYAKPWIPYPMAIYIHSWLLDVIIIMCF